ncbi:MAG: polysaccharide biosynthesis protein [Clostridia bacterium]|nr:polysaccharide biosynthesis protein [Clostridia bacterium]
MSLCERRGESPCGNKKNRFLSGVFVLSLSAVIVKIIGLIYKIPMLRLLGSEGMGYFNSAYELYTLFGVIATAGLPVAMSVMIAGTLSSSRGRAERIFRVSMCAFLVLGLVGMVLLLGFARPFAAFLGSDNATYCICAIAPSVLFICLAGAYRGYFQGLGEMAPTAISQIVEALGKLILGLIFATVAISAGMTTESVAAFAVLGLTLGGAASALCLVLIKWLRASSSPPMLSEERGDPILPTLLKTAVPVTLSSLVINLTKVIDMTLILRRLQATGYGSEEAFAAYGSYTTLALPLFSLAPALISSVALPLIPALSEAVSSQDFEAQTRAVSDAVKLTALISCPISVGLTLFARPVLELIFHGETSAIDEATPLLSILGVSVTLSCLITVSNAVLQAYSKASVPILSMVIGSVLKLVLAYILIGIPDIGIMGAPISTYFCDLVINGVNLYFISRQMQKTPPLSQILLKTFLASTAAVCVARVSYNFAIAYFGKSATVTVACIALAALIYLPLTVLLGAIDKGDLCNVPLIGDRMRKYDREKI